MPDPVILQNMRKRVRRVDHRELAAVKRDVPLDQGQGAATDGPEADHHQRPVDPGMNRICHVAFQCFSVFAESQSISASRTPDTTNVRWITTIRYICRADTTLSGATFPISMNTFSR